MKSRVALVTGASSGIGKATAKLFAEKGYVSYAAARRPETLPELEKLGCKTVRIDVTDESSMVAGVREIEEKLGAVDILVNNAGYVQAGPLEELSMEEVRRQFETNVFGLLRLSQLVLPGMRRKGWGRIINVSSVGGEVSLPGGGVYTATKYAVESLTDVLRFEVEQFGVAVVSIQPGGVDTNFGSAGRATMAEGSPDSPYAKFRERLRKGAFKDDPGEKSALTLTPEQVADAILHAASADRPRTRYKVGLLAKMLPRVRRALGDRMWDRALASQFRPSS